MRKELIDRTSCNTSNDASYLKNVGSAVGIITFHFVNNFGGALQAYALKTVIEKGLGIKCKIIDYRNLFIRFTDFVRLFPITTTWKEVISGFATMGKRFDRVRRFRAFMKTHGNLTSTYKSVSSLRSNPPLFDKYICGSDQIWNPSITLGLSPAYFLDFVNEPEKKLAYAPSFGNASLSSKYYDKLRYYLSSFERLSVREASGKALIKQIADMEAECLIDPTFLLDKNEWSKLAPKPKNNERYILVYLMQRDMSAYSYVQQLKKRLGIKAIEISRYGYQPEFVDETLVNIGPADFIKLFRDAEYVCTNSYHGLAFSLIFEKDFTLVACKRFKERILNLLNTCHIGPADKNGAWETWESSYDRESVRNALELERKKGLEYLTNNLLNSSNYNECTANTTEE